MNAHQNLVPLCSPRTASEEAVLVSLLLSEGIFFSVFNEFFGSLKAGPVIPMYNQKIILVAEEDLERTKELIAVPTTATAELEVDLDYGLVDHLRMLLEVVLFQWVVPGARYRRKSSTAVQD